MCNIAKLKGKIAEHGMSISKFAEISGIGRNTLYRKFKNAGGDFTVRELECISHTLSLTSEEVMAIFLPEICTEE